jgi:hypothetical protein
MSGGGAAMKTAIEMTERQRRAMEALEGARSEGLTLSEYAKRRDLPLRELYDAIAALRRKGVLAKPVTKRAKSKFVTVHMVERASAPMNMSASVALCRIVQRGCVIECLQWPPPNWLAAMGTGSADAAS